MAEELISEYIDLDATGKQTKELLKQLGMVEAKFDKLNAIRLDLGAAAGGSQVTAKMKEAVKATEELTIENQMLVQAGKERLKIDNAIVAASVKLAAQETQEAKALAIINKELRDNTAELKNQVRETQAAEGSIEQMRAALIRLQKEYDNLSDVDRNSEAGQGLKKEVADLSKELKKLEGETGRFQRNVGNYSGATKILEKALDQVNKKLEQNTKDNKLSAAAVEQAAKEQELLMKFMEAQANGFKNATQEIRENTKQLQQLAAAGLEGTEAYNSLFAATSALKDETSDLAAALKNAAPDDIAFNAAADAARGLVGVYGLASSATAVFGDNNEVLQETMVKLQAAETALQSIEAIRLVFKKEGAVFQAKELVTGKILIAQKALEGAVESKNIVIRYAAIAAQKALNAASALGAGPILAIVAAVALLIPLINSWTESNERVGRSLDLVNAELDKSVKLLDSYVESVGQSGEERVAALEAQFASEKAIRQEQLNILYDQRRETKIALTLMVKDYNEAYAELERLARKSKKETLSDTELKSIEQLQKIVDTRVALREREVELSSQIEVKVSENRKKSIEEAAKAEQIRIEIIQNGLEARGKALQETADDEDKTYEQRTNAANFFYLNQKRIIELEAKKQRATPGQTPAELRKIEAEKTAALKEAARTRTAQTLALQKEEAARVQAAQFELLQTEITARADANAQIAENEDKSVNDRSDALAAELQQRIDLVKATLAQEISLRKNLLKDERVALEAKSNQEVLNLRNAFNLKLLALNITALNNEDRVNQSITNKRRDDLLAQLAVEYGNREITKEQYEQKLFDIEAQYAKQSLQLLITNTQKKIAVSGKSTEAQKELLAQLAAYERQLEEGDNANFEAREQKKFEIRTKRVQEFGALAASVGDTISQLASIGTDRELAGIETAINALEKKKQKEIEVANQSIANEQDRAAAIYTIEARAAAERETLERRRRQIEAQRAKTERLITIGRIVADTAAAVVAALGTKPWTPINIALAAGVGAFGVAQIAKVLATPLPQFKTGKNLDKVQSRDSYEGLAWVGDGGKRERIIRENGSHEITPNVPTLTYVRKNDIILPDADQALRDISRAGRRSIPQSSGAVHSNADIIRAQVESTNRIVQTIKNKAEVNIDIDHLGMVALTKYGDYHLKYIKDQTNWP